MRWIAPPYENIKSNKKEENKNQSKVRSLNPQTIEDKFPNPFAHHLLYT
jgi:hypothetical protein